ncbi:DMT family transporter [Phreatobacter aquaticus]|uniref:DMT family transporter n=1 Tax=Phreatobacter aquaticus TaxID=2570229 RepID=A0A4D7QM95_9HYPH|nr:DMT family transporter [Phreatobacter aquaticus]QCK88365.1 DMT family transporter [Phreatobacter aquaticus]
MTSPVPDNAAPSEIRPGQGPSASGRGAAFVALLMGATALGVSPVFVRLADVGPFASAFWRTALAMPVLYLWMTFEDRGRPDRPGFTLPVVLAGIFFAGDLFFWHLSILKTTIANSTFLATTAPLWVILVAWFWFREATSRWTLIGLALCLAGGAALIGNSLQIDTSRLLGDAYGAATGVFFGLYFHAVRAGRRTHGAARLTFHASVVTSLCLLLVALVMEPRILPHSLQGWLAVLALGVVTQAAGQGLLSVALGTLPPVFSSLVIFLEAVIAAIFAWLALGEALTAVQVAGGVAIMVGIWVARPRTP